MYSDCPKGIIYIITCNITGEVYYGSTFKTLKKRMSGHKSKANNTASKQIIERGDYSVKVILEGLFHDVDQLRKIEAYYIKNNECINKNIPSSTDENINYPKIINELLELSRLRKLEQDRINEIEKKELEALNEQFDLAKQKLNLLLVEKSNGTRYLCGCGQIVSYSNKNHVNTRFHKEKNK